MPAPHATVVLALLAAMATLASPPAAAQTEDFARIEDHLAWTRFPVDARGEALARTAVVDPRGATAFWWNPAPLPDRDGIEASATSWDPPADMLTWRPLALRATRDDLSVGLLWAPLNIGPVAVRTAYDPDGDGRVVEFTHHLLQLGAARDLAPLLTGGVARWQWTVGANLRHVRLEILDDRLEPATASLWDTDLATSLAWPLLPPGQATLTAHVTAMVRNLARGETADSTVKLPRDYHAGLGLAFVTGRSWRGRPLVAASAAAAWRRDGEDLVPSLDSEHVGAEVTLLGVLSLRGGHRRGGTAGEDGLWTWGWGLQGRWRGLRVAVDHGRHAVDGDAVDAPVQDHWTFSLGVDLSR